MPDAKKSGTCLDGVVWRVTPLCWVTGNLHDQHSGSNYTGNWNSVSLKSCGMQDTKQVQMNPEPARVVWQVGTENCQDPHGLKMAGFNPFLCFLGRKLDGAARCSFLNFLGRIFLPPVWLLVVKWLSENVCIMSGLFAFWNLSSSY